ncbi:MAG: hypothetical protein WA152_00655 [Microgenomates group bacterium]
MNNESSDKRPNFLILVIILIIFLITLGILVYYVRFQTSIAPRASSQNTTNQLSLSNSYVFASPVRAAAGGDLIRVTVFILDDEGNGLYDKKVELKPSVATLEVKEIQAMTDETGKAIFDLSSDQVGNFTIEVLANGIVLPHSLKVVFDNMTISQ